MSKMTPARDSDEQTGANENFPDSRFSVTAVGCLGGKPGGQNVIYVYDIIAVIFFE